MTHTLTFMDCRGLSAPITVIRIKQAMIGRADIGLPLDVLIDETCGDGAGVAASLTGESSDIRLLTVAESHSSLVPAAGDAAERRADA